MKTKIKTIALSMLLMLSSAVITKAQDSTQVEPPNKGKGGATKFLLAGKAAVSWTQTQTEGAPTTHSFSPDAFMLMPLVKMNNRLFLDAQVEVDPNLTNGTGGGATISLIEMIAYYRVASGLSIFAGNFSPKYGLYMGVLDDFTNRYCTGPIGMSRGPQTQTGVGIQGGIQAGTTKLNYQLYISNGPQLVVDSTTTGNGNLTGQLDYGNYIDNNKNKAIGGSIGFLPLSNSNLQIDVSGQYAGKISNDGTPFDKMSSYSWAADLNYYHLFSPIMVRVLAEYNSTTTQNYNYTWKADSTTLLIPKFNNTFSGWFVGATVRAASVRNTFLSSLELGGRIGAYTPPKYETTSTPLISPWGENPETQSTVCLTYWFTWKTPFNIAYDVLKTKNGPTVTVLTARLIYFF